MAAAAAEYPNALFDTRTLLFFIAGFRSCSKMQSFCKKKKIRVLIKLNPKAITNKNIWQQNDDDDDYHSKTTTKRIELIAVRISPID